MNDSDDWLGRFERTHAELRNPVTYWLAMPLVVLAAVGVLWALPTPQQFLDISPLLNWGSAFLMVTAIYYFIISLSLAIGLLPFLLGLAAVQMWLHNSTHDQLTVSLSLLAVGVVGLALARAGDLRRLLQDLQLMMLAPAWLLSIVYRRFSVPI